jgi:3-oxoacyl-[acyl-carrier protein] reductase
MADPAWPTYPELRERVVLITGAAAGIGRVTAGAFAAQGSRLVLCDLNEASNQALATELRSAGRDVRAVSADLRREADARRMVDETLAAHGRLDVLVNCAGGYSTPAGVAETGLDEWEATLALNLTSVYLCSRAAMEPMKAQRFGRIVSIASQAGRAVVGRSSVSYGVAKAGVVHLTRFLARELGPYGITANAIAPGTTLTERVAAFRPPEEVQAIADQTPLGRLATPEDHAAATLYLASDGAAFVTGVCLDVTGGRVMV